MPVLHEIRESVLIVTIDNSPVNAISQLERQGLIDAVATAEASKIKAVLIRGANLGFIAGADIREFGGPLLPPHLPDVVDAIERCSRPVVAAIDGQALGGGLEIALGCHYRIATERTKLGLPEVALGIVPGAGGTQRLPRLINPEVAAEMIAGGKSIRASKALEIGLIDRMTEGDLLLDGLTFAAEIADDGIGARRLSERPAPDAAPHRAALDRLTSMTRRRARGAEAPLAALTLVEAALALPFAEGRLLERETFLRLRAGKQAAALRHVFFAEREAGKVPQDAVGKALRSIDRVGVIGAGTMGTGIAMNIADAGLPVLLVELSEKALSIGLKRIEDAYRDMVAQGRVPAVVADERIRSIGGSTNYLHLADCDLIIEAAFESIEVKHDIFSQLAGLAKPGAILASNTSYLDLNEIAARCGRQEDVVGLHYFSPANVMKLLEIVRGSHTAPDVVATALAFSKRVGKTPVVAGVCNGFIGNRMLRAYNREAGLLLLEGATPEQVDLALTRYGMAMGPFAVADLSGIDIGYKARRGMPNDSYEPLAFLVHDALVEEGDLGRKTGSGFYRHGQSGPATTSPVAAALLERARVEAGLQLREVTDAEIVERCLIALANEGGHILADGVAQRPGDIDVVFVNGYGFPRHIGGPMFAAEEMGRSLVRRKIAAFAEGRFARWWQPAPYFLEPHGRDLE